MAEKKTYKDLEARILELENQINGSGNREYKSRLFSFIFGREENKKWTPVRELMYAGKLYDKFIYSAKLNRYGKKLLPLPLPKLVVFYNGEDEKEDEAILSFSDAFKEEIRQNIMCRYGKNDDRPEDMCGHQQLEVVSGFLLGREKKLNFQLVYQVRF